LSGDGVHGGRSLAEIGFSISLLRYLTGAPQQRLWESIGISLERLREGP
jgi:hypothetical protein